MPPSWTLYIGTYTRKLPYVDGKGEGIYTLEMDAASGDLGPPRLAAPAVNPSFLVVDGRRGRLYAVNELEQWHGYPGGAVSSYAIQPDGLLRRLSQRLSGGAAPCYLSLEPGGQAVLVANYVTGTVARLRVSAQGALHPPAPVYAHEGHGPNAARQECAHAHSIAVDPSGRWALAADLGADSIYGYSLADGLLRPHSQFRLPPGSGPRHFAFAADGLRLYLANELDSTVSCLAFDPGTAALQVLQTVSALPDPHPQPLSLGAEAENTLADIHLHPNGRFVYASNRGHDSISAFAIGPDGRLALLGHVSSGGRTPRNFALTPDGRFLIAANQDASRLVVFRVDAASGLLAPAGIQIEVPTPVCVAVP